MDDKTGPDMLKAFMKQPVSTFNIVLILFVAFGWYYSRENNMEKLGAAAKAQELRIDRVEKKIEAGDINDAVQNGKIVESLNLLVLARSDMGGGLDGSRGIGDRSQAVVRRRPPAGGFVLLVRVRAAPKPASDFQEGDIGRLVRAVAVAPETGDGEIIPSILAARRFGDDVVEGRAAELVGPARAGVRLAFLPSCPPPPVETWNDKSNATIGAPTSLLSRELLDRRPLTHGQPSGERGRNERRTSLGSLRELPVPKPTGRCYCVPACNGLTFGRCGSFASVSMHLRTVGV